MKYLYELIHDKELAKVKVIENNEPMILINEKSWLQIQNFSSEYLGIKKNETYLRKTVFNLLKKVQDYLPNGYTILLIDGYRPFKWQLQRFLIQFVKQYNIHKEKSFDEIYDIASRWTAPVFEIVAPHTTGSAIDLTLLKDDIEIDMGTKVNEFNEKTKTINENITVLQKNNRQILIDAMHKAGFINYPTEWWHWAYGDQYWAKIKNETSIYGTTKIHK